jgi:hypothetical protein
MLQEVDIFAERIPLAPSPAEVSVSGDPSKEAEVAASNFAALGTYLFSAKFLLIYTC